MEILSIPEPKILILGSYNSSETLSGPEKYAKRLLQSLENTHTVRFITYFESETSSLYQKLFGFEKVHGNENILRLGLFRLLIFLLINSCDILHVVTFSRFALLAYLLSNAKRKIYTAHGVIRKEDSTKSGLSILYTLKNQIVEKVFLTRSDLIITLSPVLMKELREYYPDTVSAHRLIYPGVDNVFFKNAVFPELTAGLKVVFLGGFDAREKAAYAIIAEVYDKFPQIEISCIGFANKNPEHARIKFVDRTDAELFTNVLGSCNVFIAPYSGETFSITTLEATALGIPVIVNNKAGVAELIEDNVNGFLFESDHPEDVTSILTRIINRPELHREISDTAKKRVAEFTWDNAAARHFRVYQNLLSDRRLANL